MPRNPQTLRLDQEGMLQVVGGNDPPRIVFLTSPANPTGECVENEFLQELLTVARDRAIVVVDEAYAEFTDSPGFVQLVPKTEHLVVLRTLSKAFASAGLRCGAVLAQPEVIALLKRVIPPYPLATPVLSLALRLFDPDVRQRQKALTREIGRNKQALLERLGRHDFIRQTWPGEANFVLLRVDDAQALTRFCSEQGITIRAFSGNALLDGCVRISVGSRKEIDRLDRVLRAFAGRSGTAPGSRQHG